MARFVLTAIFLLASFSDTASPQVERKTRPKIVVGVKSSHDTVHPGSNVLTLLLIDIPDGWHINSATPLDENYIATSVGISDTTAVRNIQVHYPQGREILLDFSDAPMDVYDGNIRILLSYRIAADLAPGTYSIPVAINYQACNDNICLAPDSFSVSVAITVVPPTGPDQETNQELFDGYRGIQKE